MRAILTRLSFESQLLPCKAFASFDLSRQALKLSELVFLKGDQVYAAKRQVRELCSATSLLVRVN